MDCIHCIERGKVVDCMRYLGGLELCVCSIHSHD